MKSLRHLPIGARLGAAFALLLLAMASAVAMALWTLHSMDARTRTLVRHDYVIVSHATTALDNVRGSIGRVFQLTGDTDPARLKAAGERLAANLNAVDEALAKVAPLAASPKLQATLEQARAARDRYRASVAQVQQLLATDRPAATAMAYSDTYARLHALAKLLRQLLDEADNALDDTAAANAAALRASLQGMLAGTGLTLALGLLLAWAITRSITRPLQHAVTLADHVAMGDLSSAIVPTSRDETGLLLQALARMQAALVELVGQVRQASDSIATGSTQIASGSADLSRRTEAQAANLQQTAASMEQITAVVRGSADTTASASQLALQASDGAAAGGAAMQQVVATMHEIRDSAARVQDIVGVIDGIALQTNILALNAAVEAARAGEHGRGFAVVASEVRTLAQRAAAAAREIRGLISRSGETVEAGGQLVDRTGRAITEIVRQVAHVGELIQQVGQAGAEQRAGIEQVGSAVEQLDTMTQQNVALAEQSAAAAESLRQQADRLTDSVARFRLAAG